jgi:hypothetical protein
VEDVGHGRTFWCTGKDLRRALVSYAHFMAHIVDLIMHGSVPISLCTGVRADVCGDSQCRDGLDVASHTGQQPAMPVHGCANVAAAGASASLAELVLVTKRKRVRTWECAVSAHGLRAQRRTFVIAGLGSIHAIAGPDVPWAGVDAVWTPDGTRGNHPCVG